MKKAFLALACVCTLAGGVYFAASKWAIRHEMLNFFDAARQRPVAVDLAERRDYEMKANDGYWTLPVAVISTLPSGTKSEAVPFAVYSRPALVVAYFVP